jgi:hypothetical protein
MPGMRRMATMWRVSGSEEVGTNCLADCFEGEKMEAITGFGRGFLLWILGIALPIILLLGCSVADRARRADAENPGAEPGFPLVYR